MPELSSADTKKLAGFDLPPEVREEAAKVWAKEKPAKGVLTPLIIAFSFLTMIGVLIGSLYIPWLAPFVNVAVVMTWFYTLIYFAVAALVPWGVSVRKAFSPEVNAEAYFCRSSLVSCKGAGWLRKTFFNLLSFGMFVSLALVGATVTAFFFALSYVAMRRAFVVMKKAIAEFVENWAKLKSQADEAKVERFDPRASTGFVFNGNYRRES